MISLEECKIYLAEYNLTDKEVEEFRNAWYGIINVIIDYELGDHYETNKNN
jgi:hypothetical protein